MTGSEKIDLANQKAVNELIDADPEWIDILPAGESVEGLEKNMILHSGPPIEYKDMVPLHKKGMISGAIFEGLAKNAEEAEGMLKSGEIKVSSALDHNTVGSGTGIITSSMAMMIVENKKTGRRAATFPAEGPIHQGGLCGWGNYSVEIDQNLKYMRDELFPVLRELILKRKGLPIKPILAEGLQMGDENHTRQTAGDLIFIKEILPDLLHMDIKKETMLKCMKFIVQTPRLFYCFGLGASISALWSAKNTDNSTMAIAFGGNGVEFGIKIAGLKNQWFTAPAPMIKGYYTSPKYSAQDQLPWIGDSCMAECAGLGGMATAASPIVCNTRDIKLEESISLTREMQKICISSNHNYLFQTLTLISFRQE